MSGWMGWWACGLVGGHINKGRNKRRKEGPTHQVGLPERASKWQGKRWSLYQWLGPRELPSGFYCPLTLITASRPFILAFSHPWPLPSIPQILLFHSLLCAGATQQISGKMSTCGRKALTLLSSVFAVCGLGLLGIAVSTDYWLYLEEGVVLPQNQSTEVKMSLHSGLWRVCFLAGEGVWELGQP